MTPNRCSDCKWYEPARNPDTGRALPSKDGSCTYVVPWPAIPKSMWWSNPTRIPVWRADTRPCPTWASKTTPKPPKPAKLDL